MIRQGCAKRVPVLLVVGVVLLAFLQGLHFGSVLGWMGTGRLAGVAEFVRWNITPLAWCAYLFFLLGLLAVWDGRSYLRRWRNRIAVCWLWAVPAWCYFDWMNFYFMRDRATGLRAWEYVNLPARFEDRLVGYLVAFGAIAPGMFLTAEVLQRLGMARWSTRPVAMSAGAKRWTVVGVMALGIVLAPIPFVVGGPASNLAIWVGTWALLDPLNMLCGRPSILGDWSQGRWGRSCALGLGGLVCGFLWEFWNFWAYSKWVYHLPFLGEWEKYRYFEMPLPGLLGFVAFGLETWAMWQTSLLVLGWCVEGERPGEADGGMGDWGCF